MRTKAIILLLIFSLQLLAGCLQNNNQQDYTNDQVNIIYDELETTPEWELNSQKRSPIFDQNLNLEYPYSYTN